LRRVSGVAWLRDAWLRIASGRVLRSSTARVAWGNLETTSRLLRRVALRWVLSRVGLLGRILWLRRVLGLLRIASGRVPCRRVASRGITGSGIASRWVLRGLRISWLSNHYWLRHHDRDCSGHHATKSVLVIGNILGLEQNLSYRLASDVSESEVISNSIVDNECGGLNSGLSDHLGTNNIIIFALD
jgi:hypothetical protein